MLNRFVRSMVVTAGSLAGLAGCSQTTMEEERPVGDRTLMYRKYYNSNHELIKSETYQNGQLINTWTP